jgi:DNA anti-recombination protein RmuC
MSTQAAIEKDSPTETTETAITDQVSDYLTRLQVLNEVRLKELSLIERVVRVEEELRNLREMELMRHEALMREMNTRFEASQKERDTRFVTLQKEMDTRFEALQKEMDTRFEALQKEMNTRFEALQKEMNTRFETLMREIDTRFETLQKGMNTRFESLEKRLSFTQWFIATLVAVFTAYVTFSPLLDR